MRNSSNLITIVGILLIIGGITLRVEHRFPDTAPCDLENERGEA